MNMVPKTQADSEIYCNLVPDFKRTNPYYEIVPRLGSFEVSINGVVSNQEM